MRGHSETFSQLTNVDMKFGVLTAEDVQEVALSQSTYLSFLQKEDRDLRRRAFHQFFQEFKTKGKRSGAFASSSYGNPPYILMNYQPDVFSHVFTLAHEAGHSMHTWFAQKHQLFQNYGYPIFLAEVAATFNEELLTQYLLERAQEPAMRAYLIDRSKMFARSCFARRCSPSSNNKCTKLRKTAVPHP